VQECLSTVQGGGGRGHGSSTVTVRPPACGFGSTYRWSCATTEDRDLGVGDVMYEQRPLSESKSRGHVVGNGGIVRSTNV
jgi:hypothetical protein